MFQQRYALMGMGDDDAQPTERIGGDKRQDGKPERFLKIAFGIVLSGKPDPHGLCGVIPFGCGGAFKGADGVPGFLGKNGEAEEPRASLDKGRCKSRPPLRRRNVANT